VRGKALVSMVASPAHGGPAGVTDVRFAGVTMAGIPIVGEGTLVRCRHDRRRDVSALKIEFRATLGAGPAARPVEGWGRVIVGSEGVLGNGVRCSVESGSDGDDLFWEEIILSFVVEFITDGDDL
jgi:hypothetical protein